MAYPENAIVEVKYGYMINDQQCFNVLHYFPDSTGVGFTPYALCGQLVTFLNAGAGTDGTLLKEMRDAMGSNVVINKITAQCIYPTRYRMYEQEVVFLGLDANPCTAQNVAAVVEKIADEGGRHGIGSFHLGGLPESGYADGNLSVGTFAQMMVIANLLKQDIGPVGAATINYNPRILNKTKVVIDGKDKYIISGSLQISDAVPWETLRTMRRRTKGYGD